MRLLRRFLVFTLLSCGVAPVGALFAQGWSPEQQDVWKSVQAYWVIGGERDIENYVSYVAPEYSGWNYQHGAPSGRDELRKWVQKVWPTSQTLVHSITPLAIIVHDDVAVVHYVYSDVTKTADGKQEFSAGRWTDILKRDGDKWIMIADHGGETSK